MGMGLSRYTRIHIIIIWLYYVKVWDTRTGKVVGTVATDSKTPISYISSLVVASKLFLYTLFILDEQTFLAVNNYDNGE